MALMMVTSGLSRADVEDPAVDVAFPQSVVSFFRGDLGQPHGGFPVALQRKILKDEQPITVRPGSIMAPRDLGPRREVEHKVERHVSEQELALSHVPDVFVAYAQKRRQYGDLTVLPTRVFFYGMESGEEISVELDPDARSSCATSAPASHDDGQRTVFFELNGQPRQVKVTDHSQEVTRVPQPKAEAGNADHVGAPMPGLIAGSTSAQATASPRAMPP